MSKLQPADSLLDFQAMLLLGILLTLIGIGIALSADFFHALAFIGIGLTSISISRNWRIHSENQTELTTIQIHRTH